MIDKDRVSFYYEQFLENIRINRFPEKISRFQAFFACESLEEARRFAEEHRNKHEKVNIWKVSGNPCHKGDYSLLAIPPQYGAALGMAASYWKGDTPREDPLWEILLEPPIKVLSLEETYSPTNQ